MRCDSADDVARLFEATRRRWGRVDVLFNNAGIFGFRGCGRDQRGRLECHVVRECHRIHAVRSGGRPDDEAQEPQGGRIINNGSISAHSPRPLSVAYTVSKHAMSGLTKSIELDGRPYGITCGQIDIGNTRTEIMDTIGVGSGALQADGSRRVEPMFPVGDAARAVLMMANMPASANVGSVVVTAAGMPFVGRG
ncbi:SDR family oxidoreductase [Arthrobacter sp. Hiyo1]|uniref:SDR family oxidoreductase n=1 Tax=Arthrobacter sp. Hiyo1 TaxID=1588020 RepID=UPI00209BEBF2|nr:SDR family oxidoreductase [Arthrobacter sp. Hiyo1]